MNVGRPLRALFLRALFASSLLLAASCSLDGGSSGTGITTAQGNVASAETALRRLPTASTWLARLRRAVALETVAFARTAVEGIRVTIEGTDDSATTDANGFFAVHGDFAGPVGMLLERPEDGLSARLVITVPAGGLLTLSNVRIAGSTLTVDSQHVEFDGVVTTTDCPNDATEVVSEDRPDDGHRYRVSLRDSTVRDASGNPLACSQIAGGDVLRVEGDVRGDGTFDADDVEVRDDDHSGAGGGDDDGDDREDGGGDNSGPGGDGDDDGGSSGPD
jgi:hypothetical protein